MLRALVVDDEAPARSELRYLLAAHEDVEVVGEAATVADAVAAVGATRCDVVFCDIEMPGANGLDAARLLRGRGNPAIVFVTAYERYAVDAFAVEAFDYLLKPVAAERLARVLERVRETARAAAAPPERLAVVGRAGQTVFVEEDEIVLVRAEGDYSRVQTYDRRYLATAPLGELEERLSRDRFLRVHRSTIVNLARVAGAGRAGPDRLLLTMDDEARTEVAVARRSTALVRARLRL
jgi:DNA-binding LytR/AlgR family response regulator